MDQSNELYEPIERKALANMDYSLLLLETKELFGCGLVRVLVHRVSAHVANWLELELMIVNQSRHIKERDRERRGRERGSRLMSTPACISVKSLVHCVE